VEISNTKFKRNPFINLEDETYDATNRYTCPPHEKATKESLLIFTVPILYTIFHFATVNRYKGNEKAENMEYCEMYPTVASFPVMMY
jgi:hypothetical protein